MGRFSVEKIRKLLFTKFKRKLALTALHSVLEITTEILTSYSIAQNHGSRTKSTETSLLRHLLFYWIVTVHPR